MEPSTSADRPSSSSAAERDYVLGTHDEEIERLGLQHRVWRGRVLDGWKRAGFGPGQRLLDVGCGPGWATLDLAEVAGPAGRVFAVDRSRRFLDHLAQAAAAAPGGRAPIEIVERDLVEEALPDLQADGAFARWVFAFVRQPKVLLDRVARALRPGGVFVQHEYVDYATWRLVPRSEGFEEFVRAVMESWRAHGGEPDIGLDLPRWLESAGFAVQEIKVYIDVVTPADPIWAWPRSFVEVGLERLVALGRFDPARAREVLAAVATAESTPGTRFVTPALAEIRAVRKAAD
jgi:SAM-dependent methyltransferase